MSQTRSLTSLHVKTMQMFGRRGCGKTLLLHASARRLSDENLVVYLNCEDFKKHSFPNVIVEVIDALCAELSRQLGGWFGKRRGLRSQVNKLRKKLASFRVTPDTAETMFREESSSDKAGEGSAGLDVPLLGGSLKLGTSGASKRKTSMEKTYHVQEEKVRDLDMWLPELRRGLDAALKMSTRVTAIFVQLDDFYHLRRVDQPYVMDFVHRLCKDLPLYFKVATLRHASVLYADRGGQPIGAQERHDYQPINVDFTLADLNRTRDQNREILCEFGRLAKMSKGEVDGLFKGEGFQRLVLAGGGVPRDVLSLFLEVHGQVKGRSDSRIGKDDVRILSRTNFERRIEELKQDSEGRDQDRLIRGIYVIRKFCLDKGSNVFMVPEQMMQQEDLIRDLIYRLLDYRIIHNAGTALTHKSRAGTYQALVVDIGCYAHLRKLHGKLDEIDLTDAGAKESMRAAPILDADGLDSLWKDAPEEAERALLDQDEQAA